MSAAQKIMIGPQAGPQTAFLSTPADIAIFGGAAGGGKSYGLLLEPLRHWHNPRFGGVVFRRTSVQIRNVGGLWHESYGLYRQLGAWPREYALEWDFPVGGTMKFAHLEHEKSVYEWQGAQIPYLAFDELTHFTERMFFYMLSRVRSVSGIPGYVRATCNPDADSFVRKLIEWWIDDEGFPIAERSGVIRWFTRQNDVLTWGNSREELVAKYGDDAMPMSLTFIPSKLSDNPLLLAKDPTYRAKLMAMSRVERMRLLGDPAKGGNWNIRHTAGNLFRREWFRIKDAIPSGHVAAMRFWDRAATPATPANADPDWTRGVLLLRYRDGTFLVADLKSMRDTPGAVEAFIKQVAAHDGRTVRIMSQCDPGSAGKSEALHFAKMLAGYSVKTETLTKNKVTRAKPVSAQCEAGNLGVIRAPWNEEFFRELENFGEDSTGHDDIVDALSGAFNALAAGTSIFDAL